jgi:hypothetical protein
MNIILKSNPSDQALLIGQLDNAIFTNIPIETLQKLHKNIQENISSIPTTPTTPSVRSVSASQDASQEALSQEKLKESMIQGVALSKLYDLIKQRESH